MQYMEFHLYSGCYKPYRGYKYGPYPHHICHRRIMFCWKMLPRVYYKYNMVLPHSSNEGFEYSTTNHIVCVSATTTTTTTTTTKKAMEHHDNRRYCVSIDHQDHNNNDIMVRYYQVVLAEVASSGTFGCFFRFFCFQLTCRRCSWMSYLCCYCCRRYIFASTRKIRWTKTPKTKQTKPFRQLSLDSRPLLDRNFRRMKWTRMSAHSKLTGHLNYDNNTFLR